MPPLLRIVAVLALAPAACGTDSGGGADGEAAGPAVRPPPGWRTITNSATGITIAAPKAWPAETSRRATLIRSDDRLVAITIAADRSELGRRLSPARYARRTIDSLPGFEGKVHDRVRSVRGSPYPSAVVDGSGSVNSTTRPQRISVAVFRQEGEATYAAVIFRNALVKPRFNDRTITRMLTTFRAEAP